MRFLPIGCAVVLLVACGGSVAPTNDAGTSADASGDANADANACVYGATDTLASHKTCTTANDCLVQLIPVSCCKDVAYGVTAIYASTLKSEVATRTASCPACGCAAQPEDETGKLGVDFTVACEGGKCVAHAK